MLTAKYLRDMAARLRRLMRLGSPATAAELESMALDFERWAGDMDGDEISKPNGQSVN